MLSREVPRYLGSPQNPPVTLLRGVPTPLLAPLWHPNTMSWSKAACSGGRLWKESTTEEPWVSGSFFSLELLWDFYVP